jgi:hypothetical protein
VADRLPSPFEELLPNVHAKSDTRARNRLRETRVDRQGRPGLRRRHRPCTYELCPMSPRNRPKSRLAALTTLAAVCLAILLLSGAFRSQPESSTGPTAPPAPPAPEVTGAQLEDLLNELEAEIESHPGEQRQN